MAHFVYTGLKANLPQVRENAFYLCTDTREIYYGMQLFVVENGASAGYRIQPDKTLTKVDGISADDLVGEF